MTLAARIAGIGVVGPGLAGWPATRETLAGRAAYAPAPTRLPAPEALPATERRRAGKAVKLALATGLEAVAAAGVAPGALAAIFASSSGDGENCHEICETLASDDRLISPTRFHNSVHNAPAGYWSIATGATASIDCLGAYDASFGAGLLEALTRLAVEPGAPVVLVAYDAPYPEPLNGARPMPDCFGVALVLTSANDTGPTITLDFSGEPEDALGDARLEELRRSIPAARALPLLELAARGARGAATLAYLDGLSLRVELAP